MYSADQEVIDFLEKNKYDFTVFKEAPTKDGRIFRSIRVKQLRPVLKQLQILGQTKNNKRLPKDIHSYSKESICEFLGGFFDADGTINKDKIQLASSCFELLDETRLLLQKIGVHCTIIKRNPSTAPQKEKQIKSLNPWYYIQIADKRSVLVFAENISFLVNQKQEKLLKAVELCKTKLDYYSKNLSGLRFESITDIEYIGVQPVYNLTADTTNTYIANGIVTHNTLDAQEVFYNPEAYDCIGFPDIYEFRPSPIGYFVGAFMGLNQFKDKEGNTNVEAATAFLQAERDRLKRTKNAQAALEAEIVNRPIVPSEMFLSSGGNIFPVTDIRSRLEIIESGDILHMVEKRVKLFFNPEMKEYNGVDYVIDGENEMVAINKFPWKEDGREGAVVIYDFPAVIDGQVPKGAYIIGHDPYAVDDPTGASIGVIFVLKTSKYPSQLGQSEIVATYKGRPYQGRHVINDILHKLSLMYGNAKIYFENVRGNVKEYFEKVKRLDLLAKLPTTVFNKKASFNTGPSTIYGYPMSSRTMKMEGVQYIRDWLLEPRGETTAGITLRNIDFI